ncbi:hypothetical protein Cgig2_029302 [Carnegiea gigantea]|uniref:Uncharacterized protein n=1 Tax=Carnegiea gigantea TaxID=171969 RepID=A0A9Q1QRS7_9CARY|nr:hypothetical protein Cgig2_029302 [Carnegiea gigantea]
MELTQSNPGLSEEDLDGDDDDVMEVLPDENAKGVTNLEGDEEVVTMQDLVNQKVVKWIHESHPNSSNPTAATNFDPTPILATTSDSIPIPTTTVDSTPVPATTDPTPASYVLAAPSSPTPTPHSHLDNMPTSANDCDPRATSPTSSNPSPSSSTFIMDLDVPAMAAKLRKRNQVVVENDGWSDWCSSDSTEYVAEEISCDSETSIDEENIAGEIGDYYYSECDDDVRVVHPNDKIYQGQLWMPQRDGKIKIRRWDMFTNKSHCMRVILLWKAANTYNIWDNEEALHQLQEASLAAYAWLMKEPKEHWARYLFDKSSASADNSSNFIESFNKWPLLDPPFVVKKRGPIAKDRVRGPEEGRKRPTRSRPVSCSKCNGLHHNSLTCKGQGNKPSIRIRKRPAPPYGTGQKRKGRPRKQAPVSTVCQPSSTEPSSSQPTSTQPSSSQPSLAQPSSIKPMLGN